MREAAEKRRKLWILLLAVICSSFVVANSSVMPVQAAEDTDANTGEVVTSGTFGEYKGEIYTVDKVAKKGYHCISGQYKDTMGIYQDKIYWRKSSTVSGQSSEIIRMDLDGDNQTVLTNSAKPNAKFCIYNNYLYYTSGDGSQNYDGRKIDLATGEDVESGSYVFRYGNEKIWVSTGIEDGDWYVSDPGFENIQKDDSIEGSVLGIVGSKVCYIYQDGDTWTTCGYDIKTGKKVVLEKGNASRSVVTGDGLYYKKIEDGNTVLYRRNMRDGSVSQYDFGGMNLYISGCNEVGDATFFIQFLPDQGENNTELWRLDRSTGEKERIATWYNENAENAAEEP